MIASLKFGRHHTLRRLSYNFFSSNFGMRTAWFNVLYAGCVMWCVCVRAQQIKHVGP